MQPRVAATGAGSGSLAAPTRTIQRGPALAAALAGGLVLAAVAGYVAANFSFKLLVTAVASAVVAWSIFRWPRWGLVFLIVFMSTIIAPEFLVDYVNPTNVYYSFELLMLLIVAASLFEWARRHPQTGVFERLYSSPVMVAVTIFFGVVLIK